MCIDHENFVGAIPESPPTEEILLYDIASLFDVDLVGCVDAAKISSLRCANRADRSLLNNMETILPQHNTIVKTEENSLFPLKGKSLANFAV